MRCQREDSRAAAVICKPALQRSAWRCRVLMDSVSSRTMEASGMTSATRAIGGLRLCAGSTKMCVSAQGMPGHAAPCAARRCAAALPGAQGRGLCFSRATRLDFDFSSVGGSRYARPPPDMHEARQCPDPAFQTRFPLPPGKSMFRGLACCAGTEVAPVWQPPVGAHTSVPFAKPLASMPSAVYVHLPFCRRRCHYCDFAIVPIGNLTEGQAAVSRMEQYLQHLKREITATATALGARPLETGERPFNPALSTVYFGGGTPSLIPPRLLAGIVRQLDMLFGIQPTAEVSMEVDPGTFDAAKLQGFRDAGVNRVSLGVQAFQDKLIKACGRAHNLDDVYRAIDLVQASGLNNWSLDLMASLPHQTTKDWEHSLAEAIASGAPHVSVYDLQVEDGTPFGRWYTPGESPLPSDEAAADMYRLASRVLQEAGLHHYEISNYARKGFESRHNLVYWRAEQYLAFGMGAASYLGGVRFSRPRGMADYIQWVASLEGGAGAEVLLGAASKKAPEDGVPAARSSMGSGHGHAGLDGDASLDGEAREKLLETAMLRLRLAAGLDVAAVEAEFGQKVAAAVMEAVQPYVDSGHVLLGQKQDGVGSVTGAALSAPGKQGSCVMRLSDPEGFLVSNDIISSIFAALP